jgi:hypothetical protein
MQTSRYSMSTNGRTQGAPAADACLSIYVVLMTRIGQNRTYTPYVTVNLVFFLP